jgi:hypothetical protein
MTFTTWLGIIETWLVVRFYVAHLIIKYTYVGLFGCGKIHYCCLDPEVITSGEDILQNKEV